MGSVTEWNPATIDQVRQIVLRSLSVCDAEQLEAFHKHAVECSAAPIVRYGNREKVIVVARKNNEVIFWEDVEEGFNVSPVDAEGTILEHRCNQDELGLALNRWIPGRGSS
jgi:hypothetical protein